MSANPPAGDELGTVVDIVDTLEELVGSARRLPFTPSVVVNEEEILELVDRIRVALPDDLVSARHTLDERDQILGPRRARGGRGHGARRGGGGPGGARGRPHRPPRSSPSTPSSPPRRSRRHALVADAEQHAAAQRAAADDYAREVMQRLEEQLERWLGTVREGLQSLPQPARPRGRRRKG